MYQVRLRHESQDGPDEQRGCLMIAMIADRFFGHEPTHDPAVRMGRLIGTLLGLSIYPMFVWIIIDSLFRVL